MADNDEPQFTTLKERIAALNQQKNFAASETGRKPAPQPPSGRPASDTKNRPPAADANFGNGVKATSNGNGSLPVGSPTIPQRPLKAKAGPPPLPRRDTGISLASMGDETPQEERRIPPQLPARTPSSQPARPPLPSRTSTQTSSHQDDRRGSVSSDASHWSAASGISQLKSKRSAAGLSTDGRGLPPPFNQASLPTLPPSRRELEARAAQEEATAQSTRPLPTPTKSEPNLGGASQPPPKPGLPPRLPSRPATKSPAPATPNGQEPTTQKVRINGFSTHVPKSTNGWKINGFSSGNGDFKPIRKPQQNDKPQQNNKAPAIPARTENSDPPPVPLASRPSMAQIQAAKTRTVAEPPANQDCWVCRDWSGPDGVATQFPKQSLPRNDPVGHLARGLCDPFPSYTDKARAIFTWFHHNIVYDTVAFFNKNVKHMSVEDTIFSGKAVCQGYAEVYEAIARRAGLDCTMVVGHGKGYGYTALKPGERPPPPNPDGHAWNAVRIDGGAWHLLDACWGAGHLCTSTNLYKQQFDPKQFTRTNEEFGESHFPKNSKHQFRSDGRTVAWDEYFIGRGTGEPPVFYTTAHGEGLLEASVEPKERRIPVNSGEIVRFQFSKLCEHWRSETHGLGKAPLLLMEIHGVDGRKDDMVPIETDGYWHWVDIRAQDLGAPGQIVQVAQITTVNEKDARGISAKEYFSKKGKVGMGWTYLLKWELV